MATSLHTFIDIFNTDFEIEDGTIQLKKIVIPIIQRDYAQGREDKEATRIRELFLDSLYKAIADKPITLDFVYGDIDSKGVMYPLDGQQRLTTLFLLHWYAAKKESIDKAQYEFLKNFSYQTRYSSRDFCTLLIDFNPSFNNSLREEIIDQPWFPLEWIKDPTIKAMLVMLEAIDEKFKDLDKIWQRLTDKAISFYFLPIRDMGLTDELYIKMNSRGKPLTSFEHFKAEFEREIKKIDEDLAQVVMHKIDIEWTDMLWQYRSKDNVIDDEFLRYFMFVCDIICYKNEGTTQGKGLNEFDFLKRFFSNTNEKAVDNIHLLLDFFDCWADLNKNSTPKDFLSKYISLTHEPKKIVFENKVDIFEDCLLSYADVNGSGNRTFPLNRIIILYAIIVYLINKNDIQEEQFIRRIRIVHNLVRNSEDDISDSLNRSSGNRMPAVLRQVDSIIINGKINDHEEPNFNSFQLGEEKEKLKWTENNRDLEELLYETEDNKLLRGQISIIGLDNPDNFTKFTKLFECNWDYVDCALMAIGDYKQPSQSRRFQLGSKKIEKAWILLFHKSANKGYENTKKILRHLLDSLDEISDERLKSISDNYIAECEEKRDYSWRYYYIKYSEFRPGRYGKCSWRNIEKGMYKMHILWTETKWSENSYNPFLEAAGHKYIDRDSLGELLRWRNKTITCENDSFIINDNSTGETDSIPIMQNENGIDMEDRIILLKDYINQD